ncbi:hypothetical protein ONE63_003870 [Megalurothrips usitatus]|uniref:Uncharacterized protein n=1 Tax=Megalurothrips usitatus TaxID=439358 RepID=A0AAV7XAX8_9NEOP|nr:hypothetical protein ONE63_003870 [Megalurothrips usitatus]
MVFSSHNYNHTKQNDLDIWNQIRKQSSFYKRHRLVTYTKNYLKYPINNAQPSNWVTAITFQENISQILTSNNLLKIIATN